MVNPAARRKKWPHHAEWARVDAIFIALRAGQALQKAKQFVVEGKLLQALALISDAQVAQAEIVDKLKEAKGGKA